ncbi:hypothetical protein Tco_0396210 [Tanacetum coccineum]
MTLKRQIGRLLLVETDTESRTFSTVTLDLETETPESPHTIASPTSLPDSMPPTCHVEESEDRTYDRMNGVSAYAMSPRSLSIYPVKQKGGSSSNSHIRTSELVKDDEEEDEGEEDKEVEESLDSDSESEDTTEEGPAVEDEGPAVGDEGIAAREEGPGMRVKSLGLGGDEAVPKDSIERGPDAQQSTLTTWIDPEDGRAYIDVPAYPPPAPPVQTSLYHERSPGSLLVSPAHSIVPSPISSPMIPLTVPSLVASPATAETEGFLTELGARVEMQGGLIHDHTIAEERRARLDLAEIVDSMRRGQEPKGDV